jgi:TolB-like protein/cytochrome c-type biogenesis protein CcmH/NrfG
MQQFFEELKRRNVLRVAVAYIVGSWLIIQVVETVFPAFGGEDAAIRFAVITLSILFVPALILAWVFEITPDGIKFERDVDRSQSITLHTGRKLDRMIIVVLACATAYFAIDKFLLSEPTTASAPTAVAKSIVVLPFLDFSEDGDQEYFSDGISEEMINLLAQIDGLRVISRSSAFSYKGKALDVSTIADELDVTHVLEGSVRKVGDQLRVTAQLIEAGTDAHLFSQNYDRTLDDVFTIQDEIAASVVDELRLILFSPSDATSRVDTRAYDAYLRARYLSEARDEESLLQAATEYQTAISISPEFADAWAGLADVYQFRTSRGQIDTSEGLRMARDAVRNALNIDPDNARALVVRGEIKLDFDWNFDGADKDFSEAVRIDPNSPQALRGAASLASTFGRNDEAIRLARRAQIIDPLSVRTIQNLALYHLFDGQLEESRSLITDVIERDPNHPTAQSILGWTYLFDGDAEEATKQMSTESIEPLRLFGEVVGHWAAGNVTQSEEALVNLVELHGDVWFYQIAEAYAYTGRPDEAFEWLEKAFDEKDTGLTMMLSDPFLISLHDDSRWDELLAKLGHRTN